jgi:ADP-ribose pyrophosphatase YjhB (NUDIX family)
MRTDSFYRTYTYGSIFSSGELSLICFTRKVYAYITYKDQLLVFEHTDFPEAGIQVPGGSVEDGETVEYAVIRETEEETGLKNFKIVRKLGVITRDIDDLNLKGTQERHYFHLETELYPGECWIAYEEEPSDGSEGPIEFRFYWVPLRKVPHLNGDLDEMLPELLHSLQK